jgi:hypothetical protein
MRLQNGNLVLRQIFTAARGIPKSRKLEISGSISKAEFPKCVF